MKESGRMISNLDKGMNFILTEMSIWVSLLMESQKVQVSIYGAMVKYMMVNG